MMINNGAGPNSFPRYLLTALACSITIGLFAWSLVNYHVEPTQPIFYSNRAIYTIMLLSISLALLGRVMLLRILKAEIGSLVIGRFQQNTPWRMLLLFDVTAPIYLAGGVLLGLFAAVL